LAAALLWRRATQRPDLLGRDRSHGQFWYFGGSRLYYESRDGSWSACCTTLAEWQALLDKVTADRKGYSEATRDVRGPWQGIAGHDAATLTGGVLLGLA